MKSRIINDVEETPNLLEFDGEIYDLQMGMYSYARIADRFEGGIDEMKTHLDKLDVIFFFVTTMLNEAIIVKNHREGTKLCLLTPEYVEAVTTGAEQMNAIANAVARALGLSLGNDEDDNEAENELAEAVERENIEDPEKN